MKLKLPDHFSTLLTQSEYSGPVLDYVTKLSIVLGDNKLLFFPNYTDHGVEHIERVLKTIDSLVPDDVKGLLSAADAAAIISATLLHDIAMHIRPTGFVGLIQGRTKHRPVSWFDTAVPGRAPDKPWGQAWNDYVGEVKRFGDHQFREIIGRVPDANSVKHWLLLELPTDEFTWTKTDHLLIGEFLRRNHGRLAHEISLYGFPGASSVEFPVLGDTLPPLANLVGLIARSHSLPLRGVVEYLRHEHRGDLRPRDVLAVYDMSLLRVADYLQIDSQRAPRLLFKLRSPEINKTIKEWNKHGAVIHISYTTEDPAAIKVELGQQHSLATHVQVAHLIDDIQHELDMSSAVLSEVYGPRIQQGLSRVRLSKQRVYSNHQDPALLKNLPFVPVEARFDADPRILTLMIEPLYGFFPEFAIREMIQNAVDAVLECRRFCELRGHDVHQVQFYEQACDVLVDCAPQAEGGWALRVVDKGIGMKPETIKSYFLKAGASFRHGQEWRGMFVDAKGRSTVNRSGRFGIGVFASFLLGNTLDVTTRFIDEPSGVSFVAAKDSDLIELRKVEAPVGTSITIRLSHPAAEWAQKHLSGETWDWYALSNPSVVRQVRQNGVVIQLPQTTSIEQEQMDGVVPGWSMLKPEGFAGVTWQVRQHGSIFCNGLSIATIAKTYGEKHELKRCGYPWNQAFPFGPPLLLVGDPEAALPLTLLRDRLTGSLPFEQELQEDILLDFIAFTLARAPLAPPSGGDIRTEYSRTYPLLRSGGWIFNDQGIGPLDSALLRIFETQRIVLAGQLSGSVVNSASWPKIAFAFPAGCLGMVTPTSSARIHEDERPGYNSIADRTVRPPEPERRDALASDEVLRKRLVSFTKALREAEKPRFSIIGARICARSPYTGQNMEFGIGEAFERKADISALVDTGGTNPVVVSYEWGDKVAEQKSPFAAELKVSPLGSSSILGDKWFEIIGKQLIPFDPTERQRIIETVGATHNLARRIEKWKKEKNVTLTS